MLGFMEVYHANYGEERCLWSKRFKCRRFINRIEENARRLPFLLETIPIDKYGVFRGATDSLLYMYKVDEMDIRKELSRILEKNYISHDELWMDASTNSLYVPITDHRKVFIKSLHNYDQDGEAAHLQNGITFSFATEYGTVALLEKSRYELRNGFPLIFSVWEWENRTAVGRKINEETAYAAAVELATIHSFAKYPELQEKSLDDVNNYGRGFSSPSFISLNGQTQKMLKEVYSTMVKPGTDLLALNPALNVICHGNPNLDKFVTREDGEQYWTQYEWVRSAPREYDVANLYYSIRLQLQREDLWEIFKYAYETTSGYTLNPSYLAQFVILIIGREILDTAFYGLTSSGVVIIESYIRQIQSLVRGIPDMNQLPHLPLLEF